MSDLQKILVVTAVNVNTESCNMLDNDYIETINRRSITTASLFPNDARKDQ
jgi:hypothetical protein